MGPRVSLARGTGERGREEGGCTQQYWLCSPSSPGKALVEIFVGLAGAGGAVCHPPHSFPRPAVLGQRWLAPWRGGVKSCCCWYCLLCWSLRIRECQKPERSVPDCAGRGTAVYLCKGLSRRAPQEQLDAADPLVMERMLSGSLCPALHVFKRLCPPHLG